MRIVITYDILNSEGGTPDPSMARRVVEAIASELDGNPIIKDAVRRVEQETHSQINLGLRTIGVERDTPNIYSVREQA